MDASTVSRNVERLRARGWIEEASGEDSRSRPFRLTAGGEQVLEDAIVAWERAQAKAVNLLGKEGVTLLRRTTENVKARASAD
jgi:DNA-binding MarR family transcriptional regulator